MKIETRAVHAGRHIDPATGAVTMPIHLSTTFERSPAGEYPLGFSYSREDNPNRRWLEECLASLELGKEALCFSSGLAVATALVISAYAGFMLGTHGLKGVPWHSVDAAPAREQPIATAEFLIE
jgi:cystathionine beta-lyase/cystathionine gamma-synthase